MILVITVSKYKIYIYLSHYMVTKNQSHDKKDNFVHYYTNVRPQNEIYIHSTRKYKICTSELRYE